MFLIPQQPPPRTRLRRLLRKRNHHVLLRASGSAMIRACPNENRAASEWPDPRSRVPSRHFASDLNRPEWSERRLAAIGFCDYLREKRLSLHLCLISKMRQSLPLAISAGLNDPFRWRTTRRLWFSHQTIDPVACEARLFRVARACRVVELAEGGCVRRS